MICRQVFSPELMHTGTWTSHKGVPTAHCTQRRSDASRNLLKYNYKVTCLFFDQVNNYSNFRCANQATGQPSTDLSTIFVDKRPRGCRRGAYVKWIAMTLADSYDGRPCFRRGPDGPTLRIHRGFKAWRCAPATGSSILPPPTHRGSHEIRHSPRI